MGFFNKINNNTIVDTLKQLHNRGDRKIFCTNVPQTDTFDQDVSHRNRKSKKQMAVDNRKTETLTHQSRVRSLQCIDATDTVIKMANRS